MNLSSQSSNVSVVKRHVGQGASLLFDTKVLQSEYRVRTQYLVSIELLESYRLPNDNESVYLYNISKVAAHCQHNHRHHVTRYSIPLL